VGDILIIGGGFAGLEAARLLSKKRFKLGNRRIIVVDAKKTFDFLPLLPDVVSGRVSREHAVLDLADYLESLHVNFEHDEVERIDTATKEIFLKSGHVLSYEFLIISCGSVTNFYGMEDIQRRALKLDSVEDAMMLQNTIATYSQKKILIVGGGYTGIEIASHLAYFLRHRNVKKYNINIVERQEDILGPLSRWIKDYCRLNLCALGVNIYPSVSVQDISEKRLKLSNGLEFEDYAIIWVAGVQTPLFVRDLPFDKDRQGRLVVDTHMQFMGGCFAAGDAASFSRKGKTLRMSVQFSLAQAGVAAANILRLAAGKKKLACYRPIDLGFLLPMANKKACGKVLGFRVWSFVGWFFHYVMCIYRSLTFKNKFGVFCDAFLR
jgi:NADH dehydrogenase FAD-containing subunit